jgi:hypothetical protein
MQDFLKTGEFGPIRLGISRRQLRGHLGEPEDWGPAPRAKHNAGIWKYGDVEFHFSGDTLWLIFADNVENLDGGKAIDLDPWTLNGAATVESVLQTLVEAHIPCQRIEWTLDDGTERFRVGVGVELLFLDETRHLFDSDGVSSLARPGMTFDGFSYSAR